MQSPRALAHSQLVSLYARILAAELTNGTPPGVLAEDYDLLLARARRARVPDLYPVCRAVAALFPRPSRNVS